MSPPDLSLPEQIAQAMQNISVLEDKLRALGDELSGCQSQREQYQSIEAVCTSLEKLSKTEAAKLFREATGQDSQQQLQQMRGLVSGFQKKITDLEQQRNVLQADLKVELARVKQLNKQVVELRQVAELRQIAELHKAAEKASSSNKSGQVSRTPQFTPHRTSAFASAFSVDLPWSGQGRDDQLYRRLLFTILFFAMLFGALVPVFRPPVEKNMGMVVPDRIARIIKKKQEEKPPEQAPQPVPEDKAPEDKAPEDKAKEKPDKKIAEKTPPKDIAKSTETAAQSVRKSAETKGVLAFKNNFADLMKDSAPQKMGASARISSKANKSGGESSQRSIIVSQSTGVSGGINTSALDRGSESSGGQRIAAAPVQFARVESAASAGAVAADRPLGKAGAASRTDEEIQIVFDRYKSALYRIYNRELRNNPTLRGKMVLRIVIEPDGRVSACTVKSTDMDSPALSADIVDRVLKFNFGVKEGVSAVTILYPIDFLPAN